MTVQLELWHVITLCLTLLGFFFGLVKALLAQQLSHIDAAFAAQNSRLEKIEQANRDESNNWQRAERELLNLKAELPLNYVRREDYVQAVATIMAKLDAMSMRFENILLKGQKNHE
ncbi:hypothetical protein [Hydrogenophaga defluvii]|uniref:Uncharacterized protein n=1 Tax=Hydrogenophaga defluvii TaxID=249410 RepID=A0ABW2S8H3_9BURK